MRRLPVAVNGICSLCVAALLCAGATPVLARLAPHAHTRGGAQEYPVDRSLPVPSIGAATLAGGQHVELSWRSLGDVAEELELVVSIDDGRQYDLRVSPELVGGVCRYVWKVPNLPVRGARLHLRANIGGREVCGPEGAPFEIVENPVRPLERWAFRDGEWWEDHHGKPFEIPGLGSRESGATISASQHLPPADEPVRSPFEIVPVRTRLLLSSRVTVATPASLLQSVALPRSLPRRE